MQTNFNAMNLASAPPKKRCASPASRGVEMRPELERLLHGALGQFVQDDGEVEAQASTWIVSARA
jgi:hypothetical protein